jgi:hypothetical protein
MLLSHLASVPRLEILFGQVREAVLKLASAPQDQAALRDIGLVTGRILDLLEENRAILKAADRLYEAAFALQDVRAKRSRSARVMERAFES